jgi:phosphate transport system permease protein
MIDLRATGRSRRRLLVNRAAEGAAVLAALLAVAALGVVVWSVGSRGAGALSLDFFLKGPSSDFFGGGGGIAPALAGSLLLVAVATAIALPVGVLTAIFVGEFASPGIGRQIRLWLDVLNGFPSIVIGIFVYTLIDHQSAIAGPVVDWNPAHSVQSIPLTIFLYSESADPALHEQAWAGAFVLILFVLVTSLSARLLLERSRRRLQR